MKGPAAVRHVYLSLKWNFDITNHLASRLAVTPPRVETRDQALTNHLIACVTIKQRSAPLVRTCILDISICRRRKRRAVWNMNPHDEQTRFCSNSHDTFVKTELQFKLHRSKIFPNLSPSCCFFFVLVKPLFTNIKFAFVCVKEAILSHDNRSPNQLDIRWLISVKMIEIGSQESSINIINWRSSVHHYHLNSKWSIWIQWIRILVVWWQSDQVNTKESVFPVCDQPYHANNRKSTERGRG